MERYLLHFMLVMVAFSSGGLLVNAWLNELSSKNIEIESPPLIDVGNAKLTFDCGCDITQLAQTSEGVLGGTCIGSDDSQIFSGRFLNTSTKKSANKVFEREIKAALEVVSITPIFDNQGAKIGKRALIKNEGAVKIIKLVKDDENQYYMRYVVSLIEASDLKHALAYENQQKEVSRNVRATSFGFVSKVGFVSEVLNPVSKVG